MRLWRNMGKMTEITKIIDRTPREQLARLLFWSRVSDNAGSNAPEILTACEEAADAILDSAWLAKHDAEVAAEAWNEGSRAGAMHADDEWRYKRNVRVAVNPYVPAIREQGTE